MRLFTKFWVSIVGVTMAVLLLAISVYAFLLYGAENTATLTMLDEQAATISTMINNDLPPKDIYANMSRFCMAHNAASILFDRVLPENSPSYYVNAALQAELENCANSYSEAVAKGERLELRLSSTPEDPSSSLLLRGVPMPDGRYLMLATHVPTFYGGLLRQARMVGLILLISILLTTLLSSLLARAIVRPLHDIDEASRKIAEGNFDVAIQTHGKDELASVARSINTMSEQLKRSDSFKNEIISNVSHNLKTPIAAILTYTELLQSCDGIDPEQQRQFVDVIDARAHTLEGMVQSMILLSKIQTGASQVKYEVIDLEELCRDTLESFQVLADKKQIALHLHCPDELPVVLSDHEKLSTILSNLISNAVKHSFEEHSVDLTLSREGRSTCVTISDSGEGIHPDDLPHVWERFYKSPHSKISRDEGSGIGMHIVKTLFDLLEYPYDLDSVPGEGTTVTFTIPDLDEIPKSAPIEPL
ncbi:MAG: HAMP domain-containing histidine kinase [Clostridia bacterium]|nr:HAMP domain-containing histidine kinase [Clostridia bacterium]